MHHAPLTHDAQSSVCCVLRFFVTLTRKRHLGHDADMSEQATVGTVPELTLGWRLQMALGDMKVQDMADLLGVNRGTVGRWMHDKGAEPRRAYILQWALATGVSVEWLEHGTVPTNTPGPEGRRQSTDCRRGNVVELFPAA